MKKFILYTLSIITLITITFPASSSANGFNLSQDCQGASSSAVCSSSTNNSSQNPISLKIADIVNILIEFAGALAIIVIIISGIRYSLASGDSNKTNSAKNGLIYTAVGLVVIVAAKIIIDVVIGNLKK
jgi:hypothetical protein